MSRKLMICILAGLAVLAASVPGAGAGPVGTRYAVLGSAPGSTTEPLVPVGTSFTYQGRLNSGGNPASGSHDFTFRLYDASTLGNQVGTTISVTMVLTDGLFTTSLDFGATAFQGDARWLEIAVRPSGGGNYATLSPRLPVTAAPYATGLRPGAVISSTFAFPALSVYNTGSGSGLLAQASTSNGIGLWGIANSGVSATGVYGQSSSGRGVYGLSSALNGTGVWGEANNGPIANGIYGQSSTGRGVLGVSSAINGTGVWGQADNGISANGVYGQSATGRGVFGLSSAPNGTGVWGEAHNGASANGVYGESSTGRGVLGVSSASNGTGVWGQANNGPIANGVYGESSTGRGVFGLSAASNGAGVFGTSTASNGVGVGSGE